MSTKEKKVDERIAFGNSLSKKRRESGLSQEELGQKIGKSSNAVSRYELYHCFFRCRDWIRRNRKLQYLRWKQ